MNVVARSTSSFSSTLSIKGSSFSSVSSFGGSTFGSAFSLCCTSRRLTSIAIYKSFSSPILVSFAIASVICANCCSMEVIPIIMTCMATGYELLLESASEVKDSEYLLRLSSLGALSEAKVITGLCLRCSCFFSMFGVGVEGTAERAFVLLQDVKPKMPPLTATMFLFFALVAGTT
ncbi:hypothetical protein COP1_013338 [Malus domestica]